MHLSAILLLLPFTLSAPSPLVERILSPISHSHDRKDSHKPLQFYAGRHNSHKSKRDDQSEDHQDNIHQVKRTVQVQVRRPISKGSKRSCQASMPISDISVNLNANTGPGSSIASVAPTTSSAAAAPAATSEAASNQGDAVFPVAVKNSWTTVEGRSGKLSFDDALKPLTAGKLPPAKSAPDGSWALQASYPANTVKYSASTGHGYSFYTQGSHSGVDVTTATEVLFSYSVYFSDGFQFVKGGKLPGLYGGQSLEQAKSCSGGRQDERDGCFSARMMWRADGAGEFYNYLPVSGKQPDGYCSTAPKSVCDANYGDSIGRGSFYFPTSKWTTVTQRLRLNSPASASNGEQELFVDGKSVLKLTGLQIRVKDDTKLYGIMAQTFFGGSDQSWASPQDQWAWYKDWSLGVVY